jgi:Fur family ferric uptake transcriptional regulator
MTNEPASPNAIDQWLTCLQEHGYRITEPRRAVVETIATSQHVLNPFDVFELARTIYPKLGLVTVYRTIEKLQELDLVQRVHRPSDCQAFIAAFSGHQHLLICQQCGRVEFFSGEQERMDALIQSVSKDSGYQIRDHWLQLFGLCEYCQAE